MIDQEEQTSTREAITQRITQVCHLLESLRAGMHPLIDQTRPIQPQQSVGLSLVRTGDGQYPMAISPLLLQSVRAADPTNTDVVTSDTGINELNRDRWDNRNECTRERGRMIQALDSACRRWSSPTTQTDVKIQETLCQL